MKSLKIATRPILVSLAAGAALAMSSVTFAQVYVQPLPPHPKYEVSASLATPVGWHGDRYWDGHRYWQHDEWMQHHSLDGSNGSVTTSANAATTESAR